MRVDRPPSPRRLATVVRAIMVAGTAIGGSPAGRGAEMPTEGAALHGADGPVLPGSVPPVAILQRIGDGQTELALLELAIRKAELQKRLHDLEAHVPVAVPADPASGTDILAAPPPPGHPAVAVAPRWTVRRVHRVGGELSAVVVADGVIREVKAGTLLAPDLTISAIRPDSVWVRDRQAAPTLLPATPAAER